MRYELLFNGKEGLRNESTHRHVRPLWNCFRRFAFAKRFEVKWNRCRLVNFNFQDSWAVWTSFVSFFVFLWYVSWQKCWNFASVSGWKLRWSFHYVRLKSFHGNNAATKLLKALLERVFDALVVDNVGGVVQSWGVNGRDADISVSLENVDNIFHLRVDVARLVENLEGKIMLFEEVSSKTGLKVSQQ